jgi:hypothetical protein
VFAKFVRAMCQSCRREYTNLPQVSSTCTGSSAAWTLFQRSSQAGGDAFPTEAVPALHHKVCVAQDLLADNALDVLAHALKILRPHCCRLICTLFCSSSTRRESRHIWPTESRSQIMYRLNLCASSASICGNPTSNFALTTGLGFLFRS